MINRSNQENIKTRQMLYNTVLICRFWTLAKLSVCLILTVFLLMLIIDLSTSYFVKERVYTDLNTLPPNEHALVLGTAKYYPSGKPNLYYQYRLAAVEQLYRAQKANYFLLSGDNQTPYYNEPKMMRNDLDKMGIDVHQLQQDYAGYNTLDSILRAKQVFKLDRFTIVSQRFHCERALFIAKYHQIDAICFVAAYPEHHYRVRLREFFARTGMLIRLLSGATATTLEDIKINELKVSP